jgi:hypothetical protein
MKPLTYLSFSLLLATGFALSSQLTDWRLTGLAIIYLILIGVVANLSLPKVTVNYVWAVLLGFSLGSFWQYGIN